MTKKLKSAELVCDVISAFKCPVCGSSVKVVDLKSLVCMNNHSFDFAKQGYINLTTHPVKSHYSKELFEARNKIIMESSLYNEIHKTIAKEIQEHLKVANTPFMMVDLGCGEGSHLQRILAECQGSEIIGVGLDLSKEGIVLAAKRYDDPIWIVGDLAKSPLEDHTFQVILNILSPSNYKEFKRLLVKNGLVIKVVPGPNYLKELRESLFPNDDKKDYSNDETVSLFKKHFKLLNISHLNYSKKLTKTELENLVQMTPLAWSGDKRRIEAFINQSSAEITVDLDILVGINN